MTNVVTSLPNRRPELLIKPLGDNGQHVVKDPTTGDYFHLGSQEAYLLEQLNGAHSAEQICETFERQFAAPLSVEELQQFVELADERRLLQSVAPAGSELEASERKTPRPADAMQPRGATSSGQSILYWRQSLFDPDCCLNWLQPKVRFFWTRGFVVASALAIGAAAIVAWANGQQLVTRFSDALRWETLLIAWLTLSVLTTCHEFAHGLTCKRYGGEVREIGFLLMFFMPCFYCNVSDAWLFREKSKRLWVTFAGAYWDLCIWALAVLVWRITYQDSLINYLAWLVLSVAGFRVFFNFNPLIKLDGYYLLSDLWELPNMRQRSIEYVMARLRWLLWGAERPAVESKGKFLFIYGLTCWLFSLFFVTLMLLMMARFLRGYIGLAGVGLVGVLGIMVGRGLLHGLFAGEFREMVFQRHGRILIWLMILTGLFVASFLIPWADRATGVFEVRATTHAEVRAPVAGFLDLVNYEEGQQVSAGCEIARLTIPDLASRIAQKEAELRDAEARLKLLRAGPRAEEIAQQGRRVDAAKALCNVARKSLEHQQLALQQQLIRFDKLLKEYQAESDYAKTVILRKKELRRIDAVSEDEYLEAKKNYVVWRAQYEKTVAEKQALAELGTLTAESELAAREKERTAEQAALALLELGARPEEIESAEATVARRQEEMANLQHLQHRLLIHSRVTGSIMTARLREKIGDYFEEGDLICEVEDPQSLEVIIKLDEDQAARVRAGQKVRLKARALPFEIFEVEVDRIAPKADEGELQSTVSVYCKMQESCDGLRSGMTGHARIECGRGPLAQVFTRHCLRRVRTEFWW